VSEIARVVMGTNAMRPKNWSISPANRGSIVEAVGSFVAQGLPIEGDVFWGGAKAFGVIPEVHQPDLADLFGLRRFATLDARLREIYAPGLRVQLVAEDLTRWFVGGGSDALRANIDVYVDGLAQLMNVVAEETVSFSRQSELLRHPDGNPVSRDEFRQLAASNAALFEAYLRDSEQVAPETERDPSDAAAALPSFHALEAVGFRGVIPLVQRAHYRQRARRQLSPDAMDAEVDAAVARYLGAAVARNQLTPNNSALRAPFRLKFSYTKYPPGTPAALERRRIEFKPTDGKSAKQASPWCSIGVLVRGKAGIHPSLVSYAEFVPERHQPVKIGVRSPRGQIIHVPAFLPKSH
jgi:hypothetical protein